MASDPRKVYVGEIGKRLKVKVGISLADLSEAKLIVEKPDGQPATTWSAIVIGDVADGMIYYDTVDGDLTVSGVYRLYAKVVFKDLRTYYGERTFFNVFDPSEG
jgi:hypothetical protein